MLLKQLVVGDPYLLQVIYEIPASCYTDNDKNYTFPVMTGDWSYILQECPATLIVRRARVIIYCFHY